MRTFEPPCRAVVVGASGGIGAAVTARLAADGLLVHALSRRGVAAGPNIAPAAVDIANPDAIARACAGLGEGAPLRLALVATGLLHDDLQQPEKTIRTLEAEALARAFAINTIGPALVAKHLLPVLARDGKAVLAVLSARVGSIADNRIGGWYGYRASKAALNQIVRTLAIEVKRTRPETIVVALHPGTVATALSAPFRGGVDPARLFAPEIAAARLLDVVDTLRPDDSGGFYAWDGSPIPF